MAQNCHAQRGYMNPKVALKMQTEQFCQRKGRVKMQMYKINAPVEFC